MQAVKSYVCRSHCQIRSQPTKKVGISMKWIKEEQEWRSFSKVIKDTENRDEWKVRREGGKRGEGRGWRYELDWLAGWERELGFHTQEARQFRCIFCFNLYLNFGAQTMVPGQDTTRIWTSPTQCLSRATAWAWDTSVKGYWFTANIRSPHLQLKKERQLETAYRKGHRNINVTII